MTFYEKMRSVCLAIPVGKVATYGQIAMLCGKPKIPGRWATDCGRDWREMISPRSGWSTVRANSAAPGTF